MSPEIMNAETKSRSYTVIFEREEDGGFSVYAPDLPGCASQGDTHGEALANIREAIGGYLEALAKTGRSIPEPRTSAETVRIETAAMNNGGQS